GGQSRVHRLRFELPKVADKAWLDTPLNQSAVAFGFLAVNAGAAAALCGTNSGSIANLSFRVFGHGRLTRLRPLSLPTGATIVGMIGGAHAEIKPGEPNASHSTQ